MLDQAYLAIAFSLLIIFLYVSFRFEWRYSVPMMVALGHDILITLGIYSLSQREVTADTVAAVLTVLGYSLYDTVIVFDRVRENIPILRRMTASQIVNESLAETITRSLNTSAVTLIPVMLLFIFGSGSLTGLRVRADGRHRIRRLLVDLHRLAAAGDPARARGSVQGPAQRRAGGSREAGAGAGRWWARRSSADAPAPAASTSGPAAA